MKVYRLIILFLLSGISYTIQAQSLQVEQLKDNAYSIALKTAPSKSKLEWNTKPDSWKDAQSLTVTEKKETVELASHHPIVKLEEAKGKSFYAAPREIKLSGAVNFRDLGGYTTKDGKQVKWGKIYRSADISKLTDEDVNILEELNIKMVCDLRGENEAEIAPDRLPEGTERILLSAGSENVGGSKSYMKYMKSPESADSLMRSFYTRTDHLTKKYKPMFDELLALQSDQALMFHCSAGKDRTGVGAALILYALGVDESTIYKDYEATNEYRKGTNEQFITMLKEQGLSEKAAKSMMAANPAYLKAAMDAITMKYGSVDKFLESEMGLDASKKSTLKSKFLY